MGRREELVEREHDAPGTLARGQRLVDETERPPRVADQQVTGIAVVVQADGAGTQGVPLTHHADILAFVDLLVPEGVGPIFLHLAQDHVGHGAGEVPDRQVQLVVFQKRQGITRGERTQPQRGIGGIALQPVQQRRHQQGCRGVGHGDDEGLAGALRIKGLGRDDASQRVERRAHVRPDGQCEGGGLDAATSADQQFVPQGLTQPAQGIAGSRLGHCEVAGRTRDVALGHDFIKNPQQVQIEVLEIHPSPPVTPRGHRHDTRRAAFCGPPGWRRSGAAGRPHLAYAPDFTISSTRSRKPGKTSRKPPGCPWKKQVTNPPGAKRRGGRQDHCHSPSRRW